MNVVLLVVDSLRACSLGRRATGGPHTPFLDRLADDSVAFRRAHATECWTLPTHLSMFTGKLPSEHGGHFQTMAYRKPAPTLAELLSAAGYHTEVITRNSLFDGTLPGVTRGFRQNARVLAPPGYGATALGMLVTLTKPRIRRLIRDSGFFHGLQRENREFLGVLARMIVPADRLALAAAVERMSAMRRRQRPYFLFLNLYDVHAPYSPSAGSPLRSFRTFAGCVENLLLPGAAVRLGSHAYLREGFRFSPRVHDMLVARYRDAVELMDAKLAEFYDTVESAQLLDDTLLIVTSDHGEAFGEHGLYFHDASVFQTHLHVPLYVRHPDIAPAIVDDVVSTRDLFRLVRAVAHGAGLQGTILDAAARRARPVALAEHFHYPHARRAAPRHAQDIAAAVVGTRKLIVRREGTFAYDLTGDPEETAPTPTPIADFVAACRRDGIATESLDDVDAHLRGWQARAAGT